MPAWYNKRIHLRRFFYLKQSKWMWNVPEFFLFDVFMQYFLSNEKFYSTLLAQFPKYWQRFPHLLLNKWHFRGQINAPPIRLELINVDVSMNSRAMNPPLSLARACSSVGWSSAKSVLLAFSRQRVRQIVFWKCLASYKYIETRPTLYICTRSDKNTRSLHFHTSIYREREFLLLWLSVFRSLMAFQKPIFGWVNDEQRTANIL